MEWPYAPMTSKRVALSQKIKNRLAQRIHWADGLRGCADLVEMQEGNRSLSLATGLLAVVVGAEHADFLTQVQAGCLEGLQGPIGFGAAVIGDDYRRTEFQFFGAITIGRDSCLSTFQRVSLAWSRAEKWKWVS